MYILKKKKHIPCLHVYVYFLKSYGVRKITQCVVFVIKQRRRQKTGVAPLRMFPDLISMQMRVALVIHQMTVGIRDNSNA